MSNVSKTGQQEEWHADPSEPNLLGELAFEDMIEVSERTNRVKEETSRRDPQTLRIAEDGDPLQTEGVSSPSKVVNSNEGMRASREVMSAANTIDDQEESDGAVIEVNEELKKGLPPVAEGNSKLVASPRPHEEGEGFWQEGGAEAGRRERRAGEGNDERIRSLGQAKLQMEEREDVRDERREIRRSVNFDLGIQDGDELAFGEHEEGSLSAGGSLATEKERELEEKCRELAKKLAEANAKLGQANAKLGQANAKLGQANAKLGQANAKLGRANVKMKDVDSTLLDEQESKS
ncbi:hypothetical protein TrCOL_g6035 [Triparma columacea]|uniref:Uncharacterized protein n=1 Tax=Triparma columacea TaxID=722753 RepID=A0A9W7GCA0_9STRA|nr:hypothetical protein TrCOL_g6035 [Triparma columacea]